MADPNLFVIELPAGDVNGFLIDWTAGWSPTVKRYQSSQWLSAGFDGVCFRGAGKHVTTIKPDNSMVQDNIFVVQHNGIVKFENLSIETGQAGKGKAVHMGFANPSGPIHEKFALHLKNVSIECPVRGVWGLFGYQCDFVLEDVELNCYKTNEHALYAHGFSKNGILYDRVKVESGAEGLKATARPSECRWVGPILPSIIVRNSIFKNWNAPWSWRGGAGICVQGASANVLVEYTQFWGHVYNDASGNVTRDQGRCIMIDDSGADFYDVESGLPQAQGGKTANGHVVVRLSGLSHTGRYQPWNNNIMRVGTLAPWRPNPWCALSVKINNCGVFGDNSFVSMSGGPNGSVKNLIKVQGCNTDLIRDTMDGLGMYHDIESKLNVPSGLRPVSQGFLWP